MKYWTVALLIFAIFLGLFIYNMNIPAPVQPPATAGSTAADSATKPAENEAAAAQVRIANPDPFYQVAWEKLAQEYSSLTGVNVTIVEETEDATIFPVRDAGELKGRQGQCYDLSGTDAYAQLASWDLALTAEGKVCGIASDVDAYGLIYNATLLAQLGHSRKDIMGFAKLKEVAERINATPDLGFAAFASPDMTDEFVSRLAAMPGDIRAFWDLYIANTSQLQNVTVEGSIQEVLEGKAVFYLGSIIDYEALAELGDHQLDIMPLYIGLENEQQQGLCVSACSYWCVSTEAEQRDIQASVDFLRFLVYPRKDGTVPVDDLGLLAPYRQASGATNPLEKSLRLDLAEGKEYLICDHLTEPPAGLSQALLAYAADPTDEHWADVTAAMGK